GDTLPMVPGHRVNAGLVVPMLSGTGARPSLYATLDARYVGRQWLRGDEANATRRLADYAVADASVTVNWRELELRAMVRNVFDRAVHHSSRSRGMPIAASRHSPAKRQTGHAPGIELSRGRSSRVAGFAL